MAKGKESRQYCRQHPPAPPRVLPDGVSHERANAILAGGLKWVNGTILHYAFFARGPWKVPEPQRAVVRAAFKEWKALGIGLEYQEVPDLSESEVRIGYSDDGSWSFVGRDVLHRSTKQRTMNFGWDLTNPYGHTTALHEIGHTLGLEHEHQNPFAGIVWNEEAVYTSLGGPPNNWPRATTFSNILRKLSVSEVEGSRWDPKSIMEYAFDAGLIVKPARFQSGLNPPGTISAADKKWALKWYPPLPRAAPPALVPMQSVPLELASGQQGDFRFEPPASRRYEIGTFGHSDTLLVLFENIDGDLRFLAGDDDSGLERNAKLAVKLFKGRSYTLRVRVVYAGDAGSTGVMCW